MGFLHHSTIPLPVYTYSHGLPQAQRQAPDLVTPWRGCPVRRGADSRGVARPFRYP